MARPTALGNPFEVNKPYTRAEAISRYRTWFSAQVAARSSKVMAQLERIITAARAGDVTLLCHCALAPCHAEVIAEYVRDQLAKST